MPGANATLMDLPPTSPGWFFKPMYVNYHGDASATVPTAAGIVANLNADANTLVARRRLRPRADGARWRPLLRRRVPALHVALDLRDTPRRWAARDIESSVSGIGDLTVVPVMLGWKSDDWQYDFLMPVYAPTGSYEVGRLGNTGLNYWTFDPIGGVAYSNAKSGFNAAAHLGYAMNTENNATSYKSGDILHVDASVQQIFPLGSGFANVGAEAWYFQQVTCDSGSGATLGCFKGRTAGIGPVLGYIQPVGESKLLLELKWLPELDTKNRLNGDYIWVKMVYKF